MSFLPGRGKPHVRPFTGWKTMWKALWVRGKALNVYTDIWESPPANNETATKQNPNIKTKFIIMKS